MLRPILLGLMSNHCAAPELTLVLWPQPNENFDIPVANWHGAVPTNDASPSRVRREEFGSRTFGRLQNAGVFGV